MDIATEKYEPGEFQQAPPSFVLETIRSFIKRMVDFLTITDEDCRKAGVYFDEERYG